MPKMERKLTTFRSYIDGGEDDEGDLQPFLHPGEVIIAQAKKVLKFTALSELAKGIMGELFVTNFKVSFVSADSSCYHLVDSGQPNLLLGATDICLINVESVYQVFDNKKNKKLVPGSSVTVKAPILQIKCRDFRTHVFSFKFTPLGDDKAVTNAVLHHAFPPRLELLFAYEYKGITQTDDNSPFGATVMFTHVLDWEKELERLSCNQWRVTHVNENFRMTETHPDKYVVPRFLLDQELTTAAPNFQGNRLPIWSWGNSEGYAIMRSSNFIPNANENQQKYPMLNAFARTHPNGDNPMIIDLDSKISSVPDISQSHSRLRELCTPDSPSHFWEQDCRFLSELEASQWLRVVCTCLGVAKRVATAVTSGKKSVLLQENEGRDLTCIVSSLAQIILDGHYRTIRGFQSLIQKEWVAMGHPFLTRLGRLKKQDNESAVFLVFLDCVWQLLHQFPASFQFTETYLTTVWDSAHISIFDTFLFDCEKERRRAATAYTSPLPLRSVWNWLSQFTREQTSSFVNPLYSFGEDVLDVADLPSFVRPKAPNIHHRMKAAADANRTTWAPGALTGSGDYKRKGDRCDSVYRSSSLWSVKSAAAAWCVPEVLDAVAACRRKWPKHDVLPVQCELALVKIWTQCYFRWLLLAQINGGGLPVVRLQQSLLTNEVRSLRRQITALVSGDSTTNLGGTENSNPAPNNSPAKMDRKEMVTSAHPFSAGGISPAHGLPLSFYRQNSLLYDDEEEEEDGKMYDM